jgi:hypothetical protein
MASSKACGNKRNFPSTMNNIVRPLLGTVQLEGGSRKLFIFPAGYSLSQSGNKFNSGPTN